MEPVGDQATPSIVIGNGGPGNPRFAVVKRAHGVKKMGKAAQTFANRGLHIIICTRCMTSTDQNVVLGQLGNGSCLGLFRCHRYHNAAIGQAA